MVYYACKQEVRKSNQVYKHTKAHNFPPYHIIGRRCSRDATPSFFLGERGIAAHILPLSATLALSYIRKVCACRARSGKDKLCTTLRARTKYVKLAVHPRQLRFAHLDKIPTLTRYRKRKAKRRVRSIPTKP